MELGSTLFSVARKGLGWAYRLVERWICGRAYAVSTQYVLHRELIEARPRPLGEHLGYQLLWQEYSRGARQRTPTIEIRATGEALLSKVVISVSASNHRVSFHDDVVLRNVDQRRHLGALPSIPFRNLRIEGGLVYSPYDQFRVELVEIRDESGVSLLPSRPVIVVFNPFDRLEVAMGVEQDYVERWGKVFSLRFIELEITEELVRIHAWRIYRSGLVKALTKPLESRRAAKIVFWARNAILARPLERALEQHIAEYAEYSASSESKERSVAEVE